MASQYYNRYNDFLINGEQTVVPFVNLPQKPSDKVFIYKVGKSRLDKTSQEFYNSPVFNWLILHTIETTEESTKHIITLTTYFPPAVHLFVRTNTASLYTNLDYWKGQ
jgi:hypothetical protein